VWILRGSNADVDGHSVRECAQILVVPDKQALQPALPRHSQQPGGTTLLQLAFIPNITRKLLQSKTIIWTWQSLHFMA